MPCLQNPLRPLVRLYPAFRYGPHSYVSRVDKGTDVLWDRPRMFSQFMLKCEWLGLTKTLQWHLIVFEILVEFLALAIEAYGMYSCLFSYYFYFISGDFLPHSNVLTTSFFSLCFAEIIPFGPLLYPPGTCCSLPPKPLDLPTANSFSSFNCYFKCHFLEVPPWLLYLEQTQ